MILWAVPAGISALGIAAVLAVAGKLAREAVALQVELKKLQALRVPVEDVRHGALAARAAVARLTSADR